jgi:hypothetical protein
MKGIFIEGGIKNANNRIYPVTEINKAVLTLQKQIDEHNGVLGEADHPEDLKINLDRVSHIITKMWMDGTKGCGKLKLLPTPMGNLITTMLEAGVKLGVSSRGSGNVDERTGNVSDFEIITVDVVAQPSAHNAYPSPVYESLLNMNKGHKILEIASDPTAQKHLRKSVTEFIKALKLK